MRAVPTASDAAHGTTIGQAQFRQLRELVHRESAIVLDPGKEYLVESRLAPVARAEGVDVNELIHRVMFGGSADLRRQVIDAMTTNETSFFRDVHPWSAMRDAILPGLIATRSSTKRLTVWSAACSSGQEAYSFLMLLEEHFPEIARTWDVKVLATDLSTSMIERCRQGTFTSLEINRGLPPAHLRRWFTRDGAVWRIDPGLHARVEARVSNLADPSTMFGIVDIDLVLMRNVLIYFDATTKTRIMADVRRRMRRDGVLVLGSSELTVGPEHGFARHQEGRTAFFRLA